MTLNNLRKELEAERKKRTASEAREAEIAEELKERIADIQRTSEGAAKELEIAREAFEKQKEEYNALKESSASKEEEL